MESIDEMVSSHELYHWGVKGMKWGRRRYQNSDGSLTPAGQKRYDKAMDKIQTKEKKISNKKAYIEQKNKIKEAKKKLQDEKKDYKDYKNKQSIEKKAEKETKKEQKKMEASKNKPISEMTNDELLAYKQRLQAEKDIYNLKSEINRLNPPPEASGKKVVDFVKDFTMNEIWGDVTKPAVKKFLDKKIGAESTSEINKLIKEANIWKQKENISKSKNTIWNNDKNQREYSENRAKKESDRVAKEAKEAQKDKEAAKKEAYEKAKKQVDDYNTPWEEQEGTYRQKGSDLKWNKEPVNRDGSDRLRIEQIDRYETTGKDVIGKGTSRYTGHNNGPIIDADYRDVITNYPVVVNRGERSYNKVIALIEDKQIKHSDNLYHHGVTNMELGVS